MSTRIHQKKIQRSLVVFWALSIFALSPQRAHAATELAGATLEAKAAVGAEICPDAEALRAQTLKLGTPRATERSALHVAIEFEPIDAGFRAVVRTSGRTEGTRELHADGPTCEPLAAATAVFLAVLLDLRPPNEPESRAEAATPLAEPKGADENRASAPGARTRRRFRYLSVGAQLSANYGLLGSAVSDSFGGEARLRLPHVELVLGGFGGPARSVDYPPGSIALNLAAGRVGLCGYLDARADHLELGACATLLLGQLSASGQGFYEDRSASSFWSAGAIGATLGIPLARHWALRFGMDLVIPFKRYTLEVERSGEVFESSPVGLALSLGPEFRFR